MEQTCSFFSIKNGIYVGCKNPSEYMIPEEKKFSVDMCAMHNHMESTGIPINCWRCGDDRKKDEEEDYGGEDKYEETGEEPTLGEIVLTWASEFASKYPIPYPYTHPIREIPEHSRVRK